MTVISVYDSVVNFIGAVVIGEVSDFNRGVNGEKDSRSEDAKEVREIGVAKFVRQESFTAGEVKLKHHRHLSNAVNYNVLDIMILRDTAASSDKVCK